MKSPIFLFSLPRSGSTLLQRVLMSHKDIASIAEPWLLLPLCYANKKEGVLAEYAHISAFNALGDFINYLPNKEDDYNKALGDFANTLYEKQCLKNEKYFLDKTPRYYFIIPEIIKIFPDAKFIFLFRNPVNVMSSMMQTWSNGRFNKMYAYERDLNFGPKALSEGYEMHKNKSLAIQYEEFVTSPDKFINEICEYLNIDYDENMLLNIDSQVMKGRMGDPTGVKEYKTIDKKPIGKWKNNFDSSFRKKYLKNYINSIEEEVLKVQGYDKQEILSNIEKLETSNKNLLQDKIDLIYSDLVQFIKPNIWFGNKFKTWAKNRFFS